VVIARPALGESALHVSLRSLESISSSGFQDRFLDAPMLSARTDKYFRYFSLFLSYGLMGICINYLLFVDKSHFEKSHGEMFADNAEAWLGMVELVSLS